MGLDFLPDGPVEGVNHGGKAENDCCRRSQLSECGCYRLTDKPHNRFINLDQPKRQQSRYVPLKVASPLGAWAQES